MSTHTKTILVVVGFLFGVYLALVSSFATEIAITSFFLGLTQIVIYYFEKKKESGDGRKIKERKGAYGNLPFFYFSLATLLFSLGLSLGVLRGQFTEEKKSYVCETSCTFSGEVVSSPETKNQYQVFSVKKIEENKNLYEIEIKTTLYPKYRIGEMLTFSGKVTQPELIMPHKTGETFSKSFDYLSYLHTKNIGSVMFYPRIEKITSSVSQFNFILGRIKENCITHITLYVKEPSASLGVGMLFGVSSMSETLLQTFRVSGLSHIVVLSGFNIVILISTIFFIFRFLPSLLRIFFATALVIIFVIMVGTSSSIVRASMMAFISLLSLFFCRAYVAKQALIISLFLIILYDPSSLLHDISLHLSFLATTGLVYMSEPLQKIVKKYTNNTFSFLQEIFVTTLSAYLITMPYSMYTFGKISLYALFANVLVTPFVPLSMLLTFITLVFSYLSETLAGLFGFLDTCLLSAIIFVAKSVESFSFSSISSTISFSFMSFLYLLLFVFVKYIDVSLKDETRITKEDEVLGGVISY